MSGKSGTEGGRQVQVWVLYHKVAVVAGVRKALAAQDGLFLLVFAQMAQKNLYGFISGSF